MLPIPSISYLKTEDMRPSTPDQIQNTAKAVIPRLGTVIVSIVSDDDKILHAVLSFCTMLKVFTQNFLKLCLLFVQLVSTNSLVHFKLELS